MVSTQSKIHNKQNLFTGILSLLVVLWLILYVIPEVFASLFNSLIGNLILVCIVILTGMKNIAMAFGLVITFLFIYQFSHYVVGKEPPLTSST